MASFHGTNSRAGSWASLARAALHLKGLLAARPGLCPSSHSTFSDSPRQLTAGEGSGTLKRKTWSSGVGHPQSSSQEAGSKADPCHLIIHVFPQALRDSSDSGCHGVGRPSPKVLGRFKCEAEGGQVTRLPAWSYHHMHGPQGSYSLLLPEACPGLRTAAGPCTAWRCGSVCCCFFKERLLFAEDHSHVFHSQTLPMKSQVQGLSR